MYQLLFKGNPPPYAGFVSPAPGIPVIGGYTDTPENRKKVTMLLRQYKPIKAELIKGHNLGASKYISLGLKEPGHKEVPDEFLEIYRSEIEGMGVYAQICRI